MIGEGPVQIGPKQQRNNVTPQRHNATTQQRTNNGPTTHQQRTNNAPTTYQ